MSTVSPQRCERQTWGNYMTNTLRILESKLRQAKQSSSLRRLRPPDHLQQPFQPHPVPKCLLKPLLPHHAAPNAPATISPPTTIKRTHLIRRYPYNLRNDQSLTIITPPTRPRSCPPNHPTLAPWRLTKVPFAHSPAHLRKASSHTQPLLSNPASLSLLLQNQRRPLKLRQSLRLAP